MDAKIGRGVFFGRECSITLGSNFYCGRLCHISSNVVFGKNVLIASNVAFVGGDHPVGREYAKDMHGKRGARRLTIVEDNVWIGHGAIILHGVKIGEGAIIGAGAVVSESVPSFNIYTGVKLAQLRERPSELVMEKRNETNSTVS